MAVLFLLLGQMPSEGTPSCLSAPTVGTGAEAPGHPGRDGHRPAGRAPGRRAGRGRPGVGGGRRRSTAPRGSVVLDAGGCVVAPGLVDLHTHLREPGREESETVETGARAAALGGYTAVVAMPNTDPPLDSAEAVRNVLELAATVTAEVAVAGAITVGRAGERLAPMAELADLGVRLFTDDGAGVQSAGLMRRALDYATGLGVTLAQHCEDSTLAGGGAMHEGAWSSRLGLPGMPAAGRGGHGGPGHRPGAGDRGPDPLPPPVDGGVDRPGAPGPSRRAAGHRRGGPPPLHPDRRLCGRLRPGVQGQPAAAARGRRGGGEGRPGRRDHRRHRHRPRPPRPRVARTCPSTRPRRACSAWRPPCPWPSPSSTCRCPSSSPCSAGSRRPSARLDPAHGG